MIELREKQFPALWYTLYQHILEMFLLVLYIFNSTKILPSRTHSCLHFMAGQKGTNKNMHTWIIATLSLKVILMMASCNNEVKFYLCQTVLSMTTVSYSCGFSADSLAIGLTLT